MIILNATLFVLLPIKNIYDPESNGGDVHNLTATEKANIWKQKIENYYNSNEINQTNVKFR